MWPKLFCCVGIVILFAGCGSSQQATQDPPLPCGVLSFESRAGMKPGEAESVTELFSAALQKSGRIVVVERNQLEAVMKEREFQSAQGGENAGKPGGITGMQKLFSGSIGMLGDAYVVNVKMIDVQSSQVEFARTLKYTKDLEDIGDKFLPGIVKEVLQTLDGQKKK